MFSKLKKFPLPLPMIASLILNFGLMVFNISNSNYLAAGAQIIVVISLVILMYYIGKNKRIPKESIEYVKELCQKSGRAIVAEGILINIKE